MRAIDPSQLHVYPLALDAGDVAAARVILDSAELQRAARFRFDVHRERYIRGRAALRVVLGDYLGIAPDTVRFRVLEFGKPVLTPDSPLQFNLAHCEALGLLAVGSDRGVGIDIELPRPLPDRDALAAANFSAEECAALRALPEEERDVAFFTCWTRKEAHLKLSGVGIGNELTRITVGVAHDAPTTVRSTIHSARRTDGAIFSIASDRPWTQLLWHIAALPWL